METNAIPIVVPQAGTPPESGQPAKPDPIAELADRLAKMEQRLSNQDRVIQKKDAEAKQLRQALDDKTELLDFQKGLLGYVSQVKNVPEDEVEGTVKADPQKFIQDFEVKRQRTALEKKALELQSRVEGLGLSAKDKAYREIRQLVRTGDFEGAEMELAAIEEAKAKPVEQPKPVTIQPSAEEVKKVEESRRKETEEAARTLLENKGLLKTETGLPASPPSGKFTLSDIKKMDWKTFHKNFPNGTSDVMEGLQKGIVIES